MRNLKKSCLDQYVFPIYAEPQVKKSYIHRNKLIFLMKKNPRRFLLGLLYKFCINIFPNTSYSDFLIIIIEYKRNMIDLYHPRLDFPARHQIHNIIYNLCPDLNP